MPLLIASIDRWFNLDLILINLFAGITCDLLMSLWLWLFMLFPLKIDGQLRCISVFNLSYIFLYLVRFIQKLLNSYVDSNPVISCYVIYCLIHLFQFNYLCFSHLMSRVYLISLIFLLILLLYFQNQYFNFYTSLFWTKSVVLENMRIFESNEYGTYVYGYN